MRFVLLVLAVCAVAQAEPNPPHPRMLLDANLRAAWRDQARLPHGPVVGAIALCDEARTTHEHDHALYQGAEWAKVLQACLVAWAATDSKDHAATAIRFMTALLDDLDVIGDHQGGDTAARRDDGYAIRNLGPYTALAYDWLHDRLPEPLRARARARWKAWLDWYRAHGYRATAPGSNYHAGYVLAQTMIAIAGDDDAVWRDVERVWSKELAAAMADGGVLAGGDWPEGWQYGPLSIAELSLGARLVRTHGVVVPGAAKWLAAVLRRHVHALSPSDGVYAGGDTEDETPNVKPSVLTLDAIALGDASPDDQRWARGELSRLRLADRDYLLYDALAGVGDKAAPPPRASWPTWYVADNTGTLYARTRWDDHAVWVVTSCHAAIDVDHRHPDAGTFVISRGRDDVIVDPSPYGTQSTLTSNAPTVASAQLPKDYAPSQAFWSVKTGFDFATQRASGIVAARCDYSDQYRFQAQNSDVPDALRDLVMVPSADGRDAVVVVVDRATTRGGDLYLRFRTPGHLALAGDTATAQVGDTRLAIAGLARSSGKPQIGAPAAKDCFKEGTVRGNCDAARFPVTDYRVEVEGPQARAAHAITLAGDTRPAVAAMSGDGWAGARITGVRDAVVIWRTSGSGTLAYTAPRGAAVSHVILDAPGDAITAKPDGDGCAVEVARGKPHVAIVTLDEACNVTEDPEASAASAVGTRPTAAHDLRSPRSGCCGAQATPGSSAAMAIVVALLVLRRPTSRERARSAR